MDQLKAERHHSDCVCNSHLWREMLMCTSADYRIQGRWEFPIKINSSLKMCSTPFHSYRKLPASLHPTLPLCKTTYKNRHSLSCLYTKMQMWKSVARTSHYRYFRYASHQPVAAVINQKALAWSQSVLMNVLTPESNRFVL